MQKKVTLLVSGTVYIGYAIASHNYMYNYSRYMYVLCMYNLHFQQLLLSGLAHGDEVSMATPLLHLCVHKAGKMVDNYLHDRCSGC